MRDFFSKLNPTQRDQLMELGMKYLLERMELADFPKPKVHIAPVKNNRTWTPARLRKFRATMKAKRIANAIKK